MFRFVFIALTALLLPSEPGFAQYRQASVDELLAADRAFSTAAANAASVADGFAPMFDDEVVMPVAGRGHVVGRDAVVAALRGSHGRVSWTPVRGGISADGTQGFTFGYLTLSGGDSAARNRKYLAYWVRRPEGWRVAAYRQVPRQEGEVSTAMMPPSLPGISARPNRSRGRIEAHRRSLAAAEQAFSDRAQQIGLRAAFREFGREDAMNMYEGAGFQIGLDAISASFPAGETTSPVRWATERSVVASSGDLGVSIGTIRTNSPGAEGRPGAFPFFTVWRRDRPNAPWRYIAE